MEFADFSAIRLGKQGEKMFRRLFNRKGQNTAEYAILIGLVVAAAIAMQTYVKRGLQGRIRDAVDHVGAEGDVGGVTLNFSGKQYEPYYLQSQASTTREAERTETVKTGGGIGRESEEEVAREGIQEFLYEFYE